MMYNKHQNNKQPLIHPKVVATCSMISDERFQVKITGFNPQLVAAFKSISSKNYDGKTKIWNFTITSYKDLFMKMCLLKPDVIVEGLPLFVLNLFQNKILETKVIDTSNIEAKLWKKLLPFQKTGVEFGIQKGGKCMIADEMGLGKTFQALAIASYYKDDWPLLIATTASVKNTWNEKCLENLPCIAAHNIVCMSSAKDYIAEAKILIITYNIMERCLDQLNNRFGVLIMDESHTLKNNKAKCTQAALVLAKSARRVILLTGTPALSRPNELYTQLSMLDDKFFFNFMEFSKRYCEGKTTNFGWDSTGCSNLKELNLVLNKKFMIRRTKEEVLPELNDINREIIILDSKLIIENEESEKDLNSLAEDFSKTKSADKHAALLSYFSETGKHKVKAICSYVTDLMKNTDEKILVFAHHKIVLEALCDVLNKLKIYHIKIDGNIKSEMRTELVHSFQTQPEYRAAILSITAANAGITLTAAQVVIFAELHWTPSILAQAESRAHRIGQIGSVSVRYLIAKGTADDVVWPMLQNKQGILTKIGLCTDDYGEASTKQVINKTSEKQRDNFKKYFTPEKKNPPKTTTSALLMDEEDDIFLDLDLDF